MADFDPELAMSELERHPLAAQADALLLANPGLLERMYRWSTALGEMQCNISGRLLLELIRHDRTFSLAADGAPKLDNRLAPLLTRALLLTYPKLRSRITIKPIKEESLYDIDED